MTELWRRPKVEEKSGLRRSSIYEAIQQGRSQTGSLGAKLGGVGRDRGRGLDQAAHRRT